MLRCGNIRFKGFRVRGAAAVVVVVVAADGCGLEVDEAAREGPGSGFSTVIRWVSSVPSRFQGGYCHESGVECMFPAARPSAFERLRAQVRRGLFCLCEAPCGSGLRCTLDRGRHTPQVASVTRPQQ